VGTGPERAGGFGASLREAREARGLTRAQVAERLRLAEAVVAALEEERAEALPAPAFVRGYLRAYARLVGADPETVLAAYEAAGAPGAVPEAPRLEPVEIHRGWTRWLRWGSLGAAAVLAALAIAWWRADAPAPQPPPAAVAPAPSPMPGEAVDAAGPLGRPPVPTAAPAPAARAPAAMPPGEGPVKPAPARSEGASAPPAAPADSSAPSPAAAGERELELRLSGTSWVEVRDASGRRLVYDLLRPGTVRRVRGRAPFRLVLGDPVAVAVRLDGEAVPLRRARPGRTLRITVGTAAPSPGEGGP